MSNCNKCDFPQGSRIRNINLSPNCVCEKCGHKFPGPFGKVGTYIGPFIEDGKKYHRVVWDRPVFACPQCGHSGGVSDYPCRNDESLEVALFGSVDAVSNQYAFIHGPWDNDASAAELPY